MVSGDTERRLIMNKLFEVYTKSKTTNELEKERKYYATTKTGCNYEIGARLCVEMENENILIELNFPTLDLEQLLDGEKGSVDMTAYSYTGELKDYNCECEIDCKDFIGNLEDAEQIMLDYALSL